MNQLPYRFHEFHTPSQPPFDNPRFLWPTLVGEFVVPIIRGEKNLLYWFCFHGADFQLCFVADNHNRIEEKIEAQKKRLGITSKTKPTEGARLEFFGNRWLAQEKMGVKDVEEKRAELVLRFLHATCELLIDHLIKDGSYWRVERNVDGQNPLGNGFESLAHLVANISQFQFDLLDGNRTAWMRPQPQGNTRLHL